MQPSNLGIMALSAQEKNTILHPFQKLVRNFESELETAREVLTLSKGIEQGNASTENELRDRIQRLEAGRGQLIEFINTLIPRFEAADVRSDELVEGLANQLVVYTSLFITARAHYNYNYTTAQRIDLNKRLTSVNSSMMLNNAEMKALQKLWATILISGNDNKLGPLKKKFEHWLSDWENLIREKKSNAH